LHVLEKLPQYFRGRLFLPKGSRRHEGRQRLGKRRAPPYALEARVGDLLPDGGRGDQQGCSQRQRELASTLGHLDAPIRIAARREAAIVAGARQNAIAEIRAILGSSFALLFRRIPAPAYSGDGRGASERRASPIVVCGAA
jgi:hypothetical protein